MKIAIYGAGSLGTVLGAYISKHNVEIDLINHNFNHVQALKEHGAKLVGHVNFVQKVNALTDKELNKKYDIILLMTKQQDNENVVKTLINYLEHDGIICTCQNGLPELLISSLIGEDRTYGCVIGWGAKLLEPGVVEVTSTPETFEFTLGALTKEGRAKPHFEELVKVLSLMGKVIVSDNFIGDRWTKLLVNSAFSGLSTVFGTTFGEVCKNKKSRKLVQCILKEIINLTRAIGVTLEPIQGNDLVKVFDYNNKFKKRISFMLIPLAMRKHKNTKASMLQDIENGKLCEVDYISGVVSKISKEKDVSTPVNDITVKLIKEIQNKERKANFDNLTEYNDYLC